MEPKDIKVEGKFDPENTHNFGIQGLWVVRGSRDYFAEKKFTAEDGAVYEGINCYNCCGEWTVYRKVK